MKKVFEFLINEDDETGVWKISYVEDPAMESSFIAFDKQKPKSKSKYVSLAKEGDEYKQVVGGLVLIPDKLIYRIDPDSGEEYYGYFSQETIEKIRNKYHKNLPKTYNDFNTDHENNVADSYLLESYIADTEARVNELKERFEEATLGAWFLSTKVEDEELFNKILDGDYTGWSVEAYLNKQLKTIDASLKNNNKYNNIKMKKSFVENLKNKFNDLINEIELEDEETNENEVTLETALVPEENFTLSWSDVGAEVTKTYTNDSDEEITEPVGQGEFILEDGRVVVVDENSNLIEVREAVVEEENETESTDETELNEDESTDETETNLEDESTDETSDLDKSLKDLLDLSKNGEYSVQVSVYDGKVQYGSISSWTEIKMKKDFDEETEKLQNEIKELKEKLEEPITDPQLTDEKEVEGEVKELTVYEKIMKRKGLPIQ